MSLKIQKRALVEDHFISLMMSIYKSWMEREVTNAQNHPAGQEVYMQRNAMRHARIINMLNGGDGGGRSGLTYEITKLRALPFTHFKAIANNGKNYLVGETKPILIDVGMNSRRIEQRVYHLGVYRVYVSANAMLTNNLTDIHMIPLKSPNTSSRFMHHTAFPEAGEHPLSFRTNTCWGDIGSVIKSYVADADIPELFRGLGFYLARYNISSPLVSINNLGWDTETPWEEVCK
jgi:hypothetical protein